MAGCASRLVSEVVRQDRRDVQLAQGVRAPSLLQETSHRQPGLGHQGLGMSCVRRRRKNEMVTSETRNPAPLQPGHYPEQRDIERPKRNVFARARYTAHSALQHASHGSWASRNEIFHHHIEISAVFLDISSTGEPKLSSRKERNGKKQPFIQQIYIKWKKQAVEVPACSGAAQTAARALTESGFFSKHLKRFMKSRCCGESKGEDNRVNVCGGCTESPPRPKTR